jgi:membrane-bound ClpP family serine protease
MADWSEILIELQRAGSSYDNVRRKYLRELSDYTGRNVIVYYSGWLQKQGVNNVIINDLDKNALMTTIKGLDRSKGLDLILHTPGGETAATESIIDYLCSMFDDMRAVVPQLAMSGGTMIACSCDKILMGKHSSLGPIDPQFGNIPAHGLLEEFQKASEEIKVDASKIYVWQPILQKYGPTILGEAQKVIAWSEAIVKERLSNRMFKSMRNKATKNKVIKNIIEELGNHSLNLSHSRHLSAEKCKSIGLKIEDLEADQALQEKVLSVHHAMMHTLAATMASKIVENQNGIAYIQQAPIVQSV